MIMGGLIFGFDGKGERLHHAHVDVAKFLAEDELKLYRLIWMRFVASQMMPAVFDQTTIDVTAKGSDGAEYIFRATGSVPKFDGYLRVYEEGRDDPEARPAGQPAAEGDDEREFAGRLPAVREGAEARVHAVKMEGGGRVIGYTKTLTSMGIPVMGHLGLTPQFVNQFGGMRVQGRSDEAAEQILKDAQALEEAGAFAVVLEGIPSVLGQRVTEALTVPTIGIGAGSDCDGQVLVIQDVLGLNPDHVAKFVRQYANLGEAIEGAARAFDQDVRNGAFPTPEHEYSAR